MSKSELSADIQVTVGVPVRNAVLWIADSLDQLISQTHQNLEIILSDNNSTDGTARICSEYARRDPRIRFIRHDKSLEAIEHFRYVYEEANSDYFMWAAHDDRRSLNYVGALLKALLKDPDASLAFSDVALFHDFDTWQDAPPIPYNFECDGTNRFWRGLMYRDYYRDGYLHIYGLIRYEALDGYSWPDIEIGNDRPLLLYLWRQGRFIRGEQACFYSHKPLSKKKRDYRAKYATGGGVRMFFYTRLAWVCAESAQVAEAQKGRKRSLYLIFIVLLLKEMLKKTVIKVRGFGGKIWRGLRRVKV